MSEKICCIKNCIMIPEACDAFPILVGTDACPLSTITMKGIFDLRTALAEKEKENERLREKFNNLLDDIKPLHVISDTRHKELKVLAEKDEEVGELKEEVEDYKEHIKIGRREIWQQGYDCAKDEKNNALTLCVEIGKKIEEESIDQSIEPGYQIEPDSQQALISLELLRELFKALKAAEPFMKKIEEENKLKPHQHKFYELDCVCTEELYRCKLCGWITNKKEKE